MQGFQHQQHQTYNNASVKVSTYTSIPQEPLELFRIQRVENPKGPRTQIIGFWGPDIISVIIEPQSPFIWVLGPLGKHHYSGIRAGGPLEGNGGMGYGDYHAGLSGATTKIHLSPNHQPAYNQIQCYKTQKSPTGLQHSTL